MTVQSGDAIVIVPGLLGFGSFGGKDAPRITYFQHVLPLLERVSIRELGLPAAPRLVVHEPPPTGPLSLRVASLAAAVDEILGGLAPSASVHIIGHSTGGLDARLLVNLEYLPSDGPSLQEKRRLLPRIGGIVAVSAPMAGAPFAAHAAPLLPHVVNGPVAGVIAGLYLLSILNAAKGRGVLDAREHALAAAASLGACPLFPLSGARAILRGIAGLDAETSEQIRRFLKRVVEDNRLFDDLTPRAMAELNSRVAAGDVRPIRLFATVSPPPPLVSIEPTRQLYSLAHRWAKPWLTGHRDFPSVEWLSPRRPALETRSANDGIVTTASQVSMPPAAARAGASLIEADHFDTVGHFDGLGESLFASGAGMTRERFEMLWLRIARAL